jgi:hypothetical protein
MKLKNYVLGALTFAGVVLTSIPVADAMFRTFEPTEINNTRISSYEVAYMSNDLGMKWSSHTIKCDNLEGSINFSEAEIDGVHVDVGDLVNLNVYQKSPVFGIDRGYDGISIEKLN